MPITLVNASILDQIGFDAVVNAANSNTSLGKAGANVKSDASRLSGAMHNAIGPDILAGQIASAAQAKFGDRAHIAVGQAVATDNPRDNILGQQGIRYIVHKVGPDFNYQAQNSNRHQILRQAY